MLEQKLDHKFKIVIVGNSGVGKTNLTMKLCQNDFKSIHNNTIGVDILKLHVTNAKGEKIQLQFWDTAGQEKYRTVAKTYLKGADGVIFVHSIADPQSFSDLQSWVAQINANCALNSLNKIVSAIVANKIDLNYQFSYNQSQKKLLSKYKQALSQRCSPIQTFQVSAKTNQNLSQLKNWLIQSIKNRCASQNSMGQRPIYLSLSKSSVVLNKQRQNLINKSRCC